jgi:ABC-2 type transport system permease protein
MFAPGSTSWLIKHELRLSWRSMISRRRPGGKKRRFAFPPILLIPIFLVAALFLLGLPLARELEGVTIEIDAVVLLVGDIALVLIFTLMLSNTLVNAVRVLYERGDFELLLSSPMSPTRILVVRTLAMAVNPTLLTWGMLSPLVIPLAVKGHPELLATYPVGAALALLAAGIGVGLALLLFRLIGPRRTRTVAQIVAALIGASVAILANLPNILGQSQSENMWTQLAADAVSGRLVIPEILAWPARAVFADPLPLLAFCALAVAVFTVITLIVGRRFAHNAAAAQGAGAKTRRYGGELKFGASGFRAVLSKEFRLLRRDPALLSLVLLRVFYLIPLTLVIIQSGSDVVGLIAPAFAGAAALLAGQLAGGLAWIAFSAEDAPQLLASSPFPVWSVWRAKLTATLLVPAMLVVPVLIALAFFAPLAAAVGLVASAAAALAAAMIHLWLQKPTKRSDFRRAWVTTFDANILELISSFCWAAFAGLAVAGLSYAWIAFAATVIIVALARRSEGAIRERLAAAA